MIQKFVILVVLFFYSLSFSQDVEAFNKIYTKTYLETSQTDLQQALKRADSLYSISETPLLKTKSLMLSATLYKQSGEVKKSVGYALRAEDIIEDTDNYSWQAKVYGFLTSEYRLLKLYNFSKKYFEKTIQASNKIENPKAANNIKGLMFQEKAYGDIDQRNFKNAIVNLNKSQNYFNLTESNVDFFTVNNEQLLGLSYYKLKNFDKSLIYYDKALKLAKDDPENYLVGLIYNGLANIYIDKNELGKAKKYLDLADNISKKSEYLELKKEINKTSKKYYTAIDNFEKLVTLQKEQDSIVEKLSANSTAFINESISSLEKTKNVAEKESSNKNMIIIPCVALLILGFVYFIYSKRKQKKNLEDFKKILVDLNARLLFKREFIAGLQKEEVKVSSETSKADASVFMNAETEQKILLKLQEFEESILYTDNNVSLATLSTYCQTNSKYLSYLINTYKKKDFNNYINELRVNYIIGKLQEVPLYRKYKIAVLSEEAGFSSQNKFSTVFKKVTTISPSVFIAYLQELEKV